MVTEPGMITSTLSTLMGLTAAGPELAIEGAVEESTNFRSSLGEGHQDLPLTFWDLDLGTLAATRTFTTTTFAMIFGASQGGELLLHDGELCLLRLTTLGSSTFLGRTWWIRLLPGLAWRSRLSITTLLNASHRVEGAGFVPEIFLVGQDLEQCRRECRELIFLLELQVSHVPADELVGFDQDGETITLFTELLQLLQVQNCT